MRSLKKWEANACVQSATLNWKIYAFWGFWYILLICLLKCMHKLHFHWQCYDTCILSPSKHRGLTLPFNHCIQPLYGGSNKNFNFTWLRRSHIRVVLTAGNDLWVDRANNTCLTFDSRWLAKLSRSPESLHYEKDTESSFSSVCFWYLQGRNYSGCLEK